MENPIKMDDLEVPLFLETHGNEEIMNTCSLPIQTGRKNTPTPVKNDQTHPSRGAAISEFSVLGHSAPLRPPPPIMPPPPDPETFPRPQGVCWFQKPGSGLFNFNTTCCNKNLVLFGPATCIWIYTYFTYITLYLPII